MRKWVHSPCPEASSSSKYGGLHPDMNNLTLVKFPYTSMCSWRRASVSSVCTVNDLVYRWIHASRRRLRNSKSWCSGRSPSKYGGRYYHIINTTACWWGVERLVTYTEYLTMFCPGYILETCHSIFKMMDSREPRTIFEAKLIRWLA